MNKTIHIKRVLDITLSVPMDETQEQTEQWLDDNLIPNFVHKHLLKWMFLLLISYHISLYFFLIVVLSYF